MDSVGDDRVDLESIQQTESVVERLFSTDLSVLGLVGDQEDKEGDTWKNPEKQPAPRLYRVNEGTCMGTHKTSI